MEKQHSYSCRECSEKYGINRSLTKRIIDKVLNQPCTGPVDYLLQDTVHCGDGYVQELSLTTHVCSKEISQEFLAANELLKQRQQAVLQKANEEFQKKWDSLTPEEKEAILDANEGGAVYC